ncbi:Uncharacterised protein [Mycobacterium tuberculosis]|uniref:Uncharacterized protein n=1 Tax=Mycobacterium tuberculosis TaxID=1773 RepID=A0A0U0QJF4_MYCTX|nr:Uncharacterised protein [Mycobacterium tuberculosis]CKT88764.1 Uncharacterised protein [Mycobacterium tuberculosis]COU86843.1 Uncharacterised protein [Mycobacterium tuberculosis]COU98619.1 Uncharacterised protein [Mycobacterium tuberculosis]COV10493.1 Uncharacterised protein [Mycobacterium tuberculosis]
MATRHVHDGVGRIRRDARRVSGAQLLWVKINNRRLSGMVDGRDEQGRLGYAVRGFERCTR